jgi:hypothetical protein
MDLGRQSADAPWKSFGIEENLLRATFTLTILVTPAIVKIDIDVAEVLQTEGDELLGNREEDLLVDVATIFVPRIPPHGRKTPNTILAYQSRHRAGKNRFY